ncbi:hypothetical protein BD310DRAFT_931470 [Dichomitus squalens]|uniref:Uncharacterized protein n=1 Tax=Dichomitus squalens TaxID=114155 RepID=A0A4Q9PQG9_9APHY|nr:hypothetical protein BD310DRAFT_931470 [Dichomitus squalens]
MPGLQVLIRFEYQIPRTLGSADDMGQQLYVICFVLCAAYLALAYGPRELFGRVRPY